MRLYKTDPVRLALFLIAVIVDGLLTRFGLQIGLTELNAVAARNIDRAYLWEIIVVAAIIGLNGLSSHKPRSTIYMATSAVINIMLVALWLLILWNIVNIELLLTT